jgi:hypothetical protein
MEKTFYCNCGHAYTPLGTNPGFNDMCDECDGYLHACINCKQYDKPNNNCTDPAAEQPRMPDGRNYCQVFIPFEASNGADSGSIADDSAEDKLKKLFGE